MDATPSVRLPADADSGIPLRPPAPLVIGARTFEWASRTYVMGIINVTPDSFSGDGLLATQGDPVAAAVRQARQMAGPGARRARLGRPALTRRRPKLPARHVGWERCRSTASGARPPNRPSFDSPQSSACPW